MVSIPKPAGTTPEKTDLGIEFKDYSKVFTPPKIAMQMAKMLELTDKCSVLDAGCGYGILTKAVHHLQPKLWVDVIDVNSQYSSYTFANNDYTICRQDEDYVTATLPHYDRIITNPPFDDNKWLSFIRKSYGLLNPNGVLVSICPKYKYGGQSSEDKLYTELVNKLKTLGAEAPVPLENWYTNKDGTKIDLIIIKVRKK